MRRLSLALCLLPCLVGMRAPVLAPAYSASLGSGSTSGTNTVSIVTSGHVAGQMIVVAFMTNNSLSGGVSSIADTGGNTYTSVKVANVSGKRVETWVTSGAALAGTITITRAGTSNQAVACAVSYTGTSTTEDSEGTGNNTGGSASVTWTVVGSNTLSVAALGYISATPDTIGGQSGWSQRYDVKDAGSNICLAYWDTGSNSPLTAGSNTLTDAWNIGAHSWTMVSDSLGPSTTSRKDNMIPMTGAGLK